MRFTEIERSLLAVNAALVARLDLIQQGDDFADSIAERSCASCEKAIIEAQSRHAEEVNGLTDEVIGVKLERDQLFELLSELYETTVWPSDSFDLPGYTVFGRIQREQLALRNVMDELAEDIDAEAANDETLRFAPEDRVVPAESGVKPADPKLLQLEVGKKYRRRDGEVVTIEQKFNGFLYPFYSDSGTYQADGIYLRGEICLRDLIEEVTEEAAEVAA